MRKKRKKAGQEPGDGLNNLQISKNVSIGQELEEKKPAEPESRITALIAYGYESSHWGLSQLVNVTIKEGKAKLLLY